MKLIRVLSVCLSLTAMLLAGTHAAGMSSPTPLPALTSTDDGGIWPHCAGCLPEGGVA